MISAKLSSTYQLAIPKSIRESMHLKAGQQFTIIARGNIIEMVPIRSIAEARGSFSDIKGYHSDDYRDRRERSL